MVVTRSRSVERGRMGEVHPDSSSKRKNHSPRPAGSPTYRELNKELEELCNQELDGSLGSEGLFDISGRGLDDSCRSTDSADISLHANRSPGFSPLRNSELTRRRLKEASPIGSSSNRDFSHSAPGHTPEAHRWSGNQNSEGRSNQSTNNKSRSRPTNQKRGSQPTSKGSSDLWFIIAAVIILVVVACYFSGMFASGPAAELTTAEKTAPALLHDRLKDIQEKFPSQSPRSWRVIRAALKAVLKPEPSQPAVVLLVATEGATETAKCLAKALTDAFSAVREVPAPGTEVLCAELSSDPHAAKEEIDDKLLAHFNSGLKTVTLSGIEKMDGETALMLHSYCDNDNAPFKDVALFLTMSSRLEAGVLVESCTDRLVEEELSEHWRRALNVDKLGALLSRVATSIAIVKPEPGKHC